MARPLIIVIVIVILSSVSVAYADGIVNVSISFSSDDAEELAYGPFTGVVVTDGDPLTMGWDGSDDRLVGLKFRNITVAGDADVATAYIQFEASSSLTGTTPITIYGQLAGDPGAFSTVDYNISDRSLTTAYVVWSPPAWTAGASGAAERSADMSTIVEEIVSQPGWSSGNGMVFILDATGGSNYREAVSQDGTGAEPALYIEWCDTECPVVVAVSGSSPMQGDEWLNMQDIFSMFLGRWIVIYVGAALAGTVARTFILVLWRRPQQVKIVREADDE